MVSPARRLQHLARILKGEQKVTAATKRALDALLKQAARALASSGYDTSVLDDRFPGWRTAIDQDVKPTILAVFTEAWNATVRGDIDPEPYATRHLEAVHNRLVGVSNDVFDSMRTTLEEGRRAGEGIPQLADRVDGLLADNQRWTSRARTVARTEVIGANNAGTDASAYATADLLGYTPGVVYKQWLATEDMRTRESHSDADGQQVPMDEAFSVGGADLDYPGDPSGPAGEVVNCRCSVLYLMPGDPDYPDSSAVGVTEVTSLPTSFAVDTPSLVEDAPALAPAARTPVVQEHAAIDPGPANDTERMARALTVPELQSETKRGGAKAKSVAKAELRRRGIAAAATPEETSMPTHAGIAVYALDTERVLFQQRTLDPEDAPEVQGTWEFPGGGIEEGETPQVAAWREFTEETGLPQPDGEVVNGWLSPDGVYQGYVHAVPEEATAFAELNPDLAAAESINPDDPNRVTPDVTAWFTIEQARNLGPALRPEINVMDWSVFDPDNFTQEDSMSTTPTEDETPTTAVIVALPAADDPVNQIGDEDKHATVLFFGDISTLPDGAQALMIQVLQVEAGQSGPFTEPTTGTSTLGEDTPPALVVGLAGDFLADLREDLLDVDSELVGMLDNATQYPTYTPHVTLGYPEPGSDDETAWTAAGDALTSITFDRLALWWGDDHTEYPLNTNPPAEPPEEEPVDPAVTAAAGDPAPPPVDPTLTDPAAPVVVSPVDELSDQFYGVVTVEDSQTGDGRVFSPGSIVWDSVPFPMPLGWQVQDAPGHDGSVVCGRIDTLARYGNLIAYTGTWDVDGAGYETRRLVEGRFLTGLSVDTDDFSADLVTPDGLPLDPMMDMMGDPQESILRVNGARVRSAAMCRVPAFVEAFVANGVPPQGWAGERPGTAIAAGEDLAPIPEETVTAALVAAAAGNPARALPAFSDYTDPGLTQPTPITITDDGRVYGHLAVWGTCHIGLDGCVEPPASRAAYAYFLTGEIETSNGFVPVGQITMGTGHANTALNARAAAFHYDDTGSAVADVFAGEDSIGIWVSGRLRGNATEAQINSLRAAGAISGDWRTIAGNLELVAALAVNVPGFPVPRLSVAASAGVARSLVAAGVVTRTPGGQAQVDPMAVMTAHVMAALDRRDRARQAATRLDRHRAAALGRRREAVAARLTERVTVRGKEQ